jgi:SAM-dependent methyltransferase
VEFWRLAKTQSVKEVPVQGSLTTATTEQLSQDMPARCLLCGAADSISLSLIAGSDVAQMYQKHFGYLPTVELSGIKDFDYRYCRACDLRFFWPPRTGSEEFYAALQRQPWYYLADKPEYRMAHKYIPRSCKLLEIGCGSAAFASTFAAVDYTGLEFSPDAIRAAARNGHTVLQTSIQEHAAEYPERYDIVCAFQVLEHVSEVNSFVAASVRVLKPGGNLIYCVPSAETYLARMRNAILNMPPHHMTHWTDRALENIGNLFNIELLALQHERLANMHRIDYAACLVSNSLHSLLGREHRMLDNSVIELMLGKVSYRLGRLLARGITDTMSPQGHSVLAVFRKPRVNVH